MMSPVKLPMKLPMKSHMNDTVKFLSVLRTETGKRRSAWVPMRMAHGCLMFRFIVGMSLLLRACMGVAQTGKIQSKSGELADPGVATAHRYLNEWRFLGGEWQRQGLEVIGEVGDTARGFAVAEDSSFVYTQTLEVLITPQKHIGTSWSAAGLCLWLNSDHYWRFAIVEGPDSKSRYGELLLQRAGEGLGEAALRVLERDDRPLDWQWGIRYRLRLIISRDRITGEVFATQGAQVGVRLWHVVYAFDTPLATSSMLHYGRHAVGVQGMRAVFGQAQCIGATNQEKTLAPVTCAMLAEDNARFAWLSLPLSRLVVNPTMSSGPNVPPAVASSLPVDLAYYVGETPLRLPGFWSWYPCPVETARKLLVRGPHAEFTAENAHLWSAGRAAVTIATGQARIAVATPPFGSMETVVEVDLDRTPYLLIRVPQVGGGWALKVNPGSDPTDTIVQADTNQAGSFVYDLRRLTGWKGKRAFKVIVFALGAKGNTTTISDLRFAGTVDSLPALMPKRSTWYPHQVVTHSEQGKLNIESAVCLPDENTVAQRLRVVQGDAGALMLSGQLPSGANARWDAQERALHIEGVGFHAVLALSRPARWVGAFASGVDLLAGSPPAPENGPDRPMGGVWALAMEGLQTGDEVVVAARFAPLSADPSALPAQVAPFVLPGGYEAALKRQEASWEARLGTVPHPLDFSLSTLNPAVTTPDAIRRTYYRAWVFLFADLLPPQPENGYSYPQQACGKPALWDEGAAHARPTSQWESVLAMQYMALADPGVAWDAYSGLMSLVGENGVLGGEGLPTRQAQTAWVLYALTGDRVRLAAIYPALKRLLLWKAADPRWLYRGSTPTDQKDAEFVVHALKDMLYAQQIAHALELPEEAAFWQTRLTALAADYHRWFWDGGKTFRIYRAASGQREGPDATWNLQGLVLPPEILQPVERDRLLSLFSSTMRRDLPFLVPALAAFPKYNYTLQGIWQYGTPVEAELMAETALRDVTLAGEFSENYMPPSPPTPNGVIPSVFGALQIIDGALWCSGIRLGEGEPEIAALPHALGLWNLHVRGGEVSLVIDRRANLIELQGEGLKHLTRPPAFHDRPLPDGTPRWQGEILPPKP
jgi:hypothetical protein